MDLSMFLVFPGILITIGIGLLLLSIILVIIAYKTADTQEPSNLSQVNYAINLENENNDNINNEIKPEENGVSNPDNIVEENKSDNLNNNYVQEKEPSEIKDNNIENNLEIAKVSKLPNEPETKKDEKFIKVELPKEEITKPEDNEEKIDVFEKEFESFEEPFSPKPKFEDLKHENLVTTQTNKQEKEEDEEEIEIL